MKRARSRDTEAGWSSSAGSRRETSEKFPSQETCVWVMRMKRMARTMRSWFRRKPLVWIFSAVSQLKIPPVGRIITIVWSPHNPATIPG